MANRVIEEAHQRCQEKALKEFRRSPKMGGNDLSEGYEKKLVQEINELYSNYKMSNQNKNTVEVSSCSRIAPSSLFMLFLLTTSFSSPCVAL